MQLFEEKKNVKYSNNNRYELVKKVYELVLYVKKSVKGKVVTASHYDEDVCGVDAI